VDVRVVFENVGVVCLGVFEGFVDVAVEDGRSNFWGESEDT
jgi:hypothetical protein